MERITLLGTLAQKINSHQIVQPLPQILQNFHNSHSIIVRLLLIIRNHSLSSSQFNTSPLLILEQLTVSSSLLVNFEDLFGTLARFDRLGFRQSSRMHKDKRIRDLSKVVYGIYPLKNISKFPYNKSLILDFDRQELPGEEIVGNSNWQLTREVLNRFYLEAQPEQKKYLNVLLCRDELAEHLKCKNFWFQLWFLLYKWTLDVFFEKQLPDYEQIHKKISSINQQANVDIVDQIIFNLIQFILKHLIFNIDSNDQFQKIVELYLSTPLTNCHFEDSFITLLFKDCLQIKSLATTQSNLRLTQLIQNVQKDQQLTSIKKSRMVSYLIDKQQLFNFLLKNKMPFWNYQLAPEDSSKLAEIYLNFHIQTSLEQLDWQRVFQSLSPEFIRQNIFKKPEVLIGKPWTHQFIDLCCNPSEKFIRKVGKAIDEEDFSVIIDDLAIFSNQIHFYLLAKNENEKQSNIELLQKLLTFDKKSLSDKFSRVCRLPYDQNQQFFQLCYDHIISLKQLKLQKYDQLIDFIYNPCFVNNLISHSDSNPDWNQYWQHWIEIILNNDKIMKGLLQIQPFRQNSAQQKNTSAEFPLLQEKSALQTKK